MTYRKGPNRRDKWTSRVSRTQSVPPAARLFLVTVLAKKMDAEGHVSEPRKKLAAAAGVSERRVTRFITQAKEAGWLVVVQAGYRSMTAEYQASFPTPNSGNSVFSHSEPISEAESGNKMDPHCAGTECSPITPRKREQSVPTTSSSTTRRLRVVPSANRTRPHNAGRMDGSRRCVVRLGLGMNQSDETNNTRCRTRVGKVARHRRRPTAAPVETHPSGRPATTPFVCTPRPERKAH